MKTLVTGATGFIGSQLVSRLEQAVILSRDPARAREKFPGAEAYAWQPEKSPPPLEALSGVEAVIHLAGEPIAEGRWSAERKRLILESRVQGTRALVEAIKAVNPRPRVLVSASAVGFYGDRAEEELDESSSPGEGFLAEVCRKWEAQARAAEELGLRVVCVRNGLVLSEKGGALVRLLSLFRKGLGGKLGSGRQWMSWIHLDDAVGILLAARDHAQLRGPVNAVSPQPVTNAEFTKALSAALGKKAFFAVPRFALRLTLGEMSQVLTASQRVFPRAALQAGYAFRFSDLHSALSDIVSRLNQ